MGSVRSNSNSYPDEQLESVVEVSDSVGDPGRLQLVVDVDVELRSPPQCTNFSTKSLQPSFKAMKKVIMSVKNINNDMNPGGNRSRRKA